MQNLRTLARSIESVESLKSIITTMKAHASASIMQFKSAEKASVEYRAVLDMVLDLILSLEDERPAALSADGGDAIHVVFGSELGLVGRFNERIVSHFLKDGVRRTGTRIIAAGQQAESYLEHEAKSAGIVSMPQTVDGITLQVQRLLMLIEELRKDGKISEIYLHYNRPVEGGGYVETSERLYPLDIPMIKGNRTKWSSRSLPELFMDRDKLLSDLLRQYFFITVYRCFCQSLAAESESRLEAMTSAEKNIDEKLEELGFNYMRERQNSITEEINDVISGFKSIRAER
jgi:F-type H+-transporting ATPase subunit gamma